MDQVMRVISVIVLIAALVGCSGRGSNSAPVTAPNLHTPPADSFNFVSPGEVLADLAGKQTSVLMLEQMGNDHISGFAQRVAYENTSARFSPAWTSGSSAFDKLAFAIYSFNVQGYAGSKVLQLDWSEAPIDYSNLWIGFGNWADDSWDWSPGPADGLLDIESMEPGKYVKTGTGDMLVAVVLQGTEQPVLDRLQVGQTPNQPITITGVMPDPLTRATGDNMTFEVLFNGTDDGTTTFAWDFGGGATPNDSTERSPSVVLGEIGIFYGSITMGNLYGGPDTYEFTLTVVEPISILGVTPDPAEGHQGFELKFDVQFAGVDDGTTVINWDFGGGATPDLATEKDPTVILGAIGIYSCSVGVNNAYGDPDTLEFALEVLGSVSILGITPDPAGGVAGSDVGFDVQFVGTEDGTTTYAWEFGGGATPNNPTEKSPTVTLGGQGTYDCSVTVDNDYGEPAAYNFTLTVNGPIAITGVTPDPATGYTGLVQAFDVEFNGTANGTTTYQWDFDGGAAPNAPTVKSPTVTLGSVGAYDCSVTVDNDYGDPDVYDFTLTVNETMQANWWMFGHDLKHTRRSPYTGPNTNSLKWDTYAADHLRSSPSIGADWTVYLGSWDGKLYAFNPDSSLQWTFPTGDYIRSSPAVSVDGTIYIGSYDNKFYAINPDGTEKWNYPMGDAVGSSPAIDSDGVIYVGSLDKKLYAVNPNGTKKWTFTTGALITSAPAIDSDGTVYVGSYDNDLYAINPNGSEKWTYTTGSNVYPGPAIGSDGTIYVGSWDKKLHAINPDGTGKWTFPTGGEIFACAAIGADGTVYVGSLDNKFYAINPDGTQKWVYPTGGDVISSAAIDAEGTIFVGSADGYLYAFNPDGTVKWSYHAAVAISSSPALTGDGTLFFGCDTGKLVALMDGPVL